jgi:hypothetical protein
VRDATGVAIALISGMHDAYKFVAITGQNDPNKLIGRSNGYLSAAVVYDRRTKCSDGLGADCGAMVEQWSSPADAKARSAHVVGVLKKSPALGSEYDTSLGSYVLRVSGALKPSQAEEYIAVFKRLGVASLTTSAP